MKRINRNTILCVLFAIVLVGGLCLNLFAPKVEYSLSERRKLAIAPKADVTNLLNGKFMTDFEKYATDHVPFRDKLRQLKALSTFYIFQKKDNHEIYVHDGYAAKMEYPQKDASIQRAGKVFRKIKDKYLTETNRIYFSLIPDKNYFLADKSGHLKLDYEEFERKLAEGLSFGEWIDIRSILSIEDYYKTDTHWRQENLVKVAEKLANQMKVKIVTEYQKEVIHNKFHGVYYGQSGLPLKPEEIAVLTGPFLERYKVFDRQNNKEIEVYDRSKADGRDAYEMFLGGNLSLVSIENPEITEKKELVVFRDSFGSSLVPLLASAYSKITLVDIRYLSSSGLEKYIDFADADVLFLYSTLVLNHSETLK